MLKYVNTFDNMNSSLVVLVELVESRSCTTAGFEGVSGWLDALLFMVFNEFDSNKFPRSELDSSN